VFCPYVDNANVWAWDSQDTKRFALALAFVFDLVGLADRLEALDEDFSDIIGIRLHAGARIILNRPWRMWRLHGAILELLEQGRCSGEVLEVLVGHAVHVAMVRRLLLSVLAAVYTFVKTFGPKAGYLPLSVIDALRVFASLLPFITVD